MIVRTTTAIITAIMLAAILIAGMYNEGTRVLAEEAHNHSEF